MLSKSNRPTKNGMSTTSWYVGAVKLFELPGTGDIPVAISQPVGACTVTVAGKFSPRASGYRKRFVPLNSTKSGRVHDIALSSESAW